MLTIKELDEMKPSEIFASGTGTYPELRPEEVRWVAVRGGIHDWAIYYFMPYMSDNQVAREGDKMFTESIIKRLVPCTDEAYELYRLR